MTQFSEHEFEYDVLLSLDKELLRRYPFVKREVIGYSLLHRELIAYTLGRGDRLIAAAFHACERVTGAILMRYLFEKSEEVSKGDEVSLTVIPLMNPDGAAISLYGASAAGRYEPLVRRISKGDTAHWQANARGVDLNHNFNAGFIRLRENEIRNGFVTRGATRFSGGVPETEPEAIALCDFCRSRKFLFAVALHSQGREIYADFEDSAPESGRIAARMASNSGYRVASPSGTAVGGGFKDWFCQRFRRPGLTIEIGTGENPLPKDVADTEYEKVKGMLEILRAEHASTL